MRNSVVDGVLEAPPSKSQTHRLYIAAMLADGLSMVENPSTCLDTEATLKAIKLMGCKVSRRGGGVKILGEEKPKPPEDVINCRGSGTTLRILTAVSSLAQGVTVLTGDRSLRRRPMAPLLNALRELGVECYSAPGGKPPIVVIGGTVKAGCVEIEGDISSQYLSGLLFTLSKVNGSSTIKLTTTLVSKPYVNMTIETLRMCGVEVQVSEDYRLFRLNGPNVFKPFEKKVEGDYSSAAVLMVAAAVTNSRVRINGLKRDSLQADKAIVDVLKSVGCEVNTGENYVEVEGATGHLKPFEFDVSDSPDLMPILAVLASSCMGVSVVKGVSRLKFKESNRVWALTSQLSKMGLRMEVHGDSLMIDGSSRLKGSVVDPHGDHRIAMACAVAALRADGETIIRDAACVRKSYPGFFGDLARLGASVKLKRRL